MNALELADHLEKYFDSEPYTSEVVIMLRQQQADIAVLTKFLEETCQIGKFIVWNTSDEAQEK